MEARTYRISLRGACPSKKNTYTRITTRSGVKTMAVGERAKSMLDRLQTQIQCQWKREPLIHPEIEFYLKVSNERSDRDGIVTSLLDLMQPQKIDGHVTFPGVILNDNIAQSNNIIVIHPAEIVKVGDEESLIVLRESTTKQSEPGQKRSCASLNDKSQ